jgi:hypothetical protein
VTMCLAGWRACPLTQSAELASCVRLRVPTDGAPQAGPFRALHIAHAHAHPHAYTRSSPPPVLTASRMNEQTTKAQRQRVFPERLARWYELVCVRVRAHACVCARTRGRLAL